jgi:1-acyl-sn-glycerol-3-phosphate acyltransferase
MSQSPGEPSATARDGGAVVPRDGEAVVPGEGARAVAGGGVSAGSGDEASGGPGAEAGTDRRLDTALRTAVAIAVLPPILVAYCVAALAKAAAGASPAQMHRLYVGFSRICCRLAGCEVDVHGTERVEPGRSYVVVPNHASNWDPMPILLALPQLTMRFIIKEQIMRIPLFGRALRATGNVRVMRSDTQGDVERIRRGMSERHPEVSILFFAEGTRSADGALHPFKKGAFATALSQRLPVLPVGVAGTFAVWPKGKVQIRRNPVAVEVGEPIPVEGLTLDDRGALRDRAFEQVKELRARARKRIRDRGFDPGGLD